jgi:tetratricopeptide (TPR) repeat protein
MKSHAYSGADRMAGSRQQRRGITHARSRWLAAALGVLAFWAFWALGPLAAMTRAAQPGVIRTCHGASDGMELHLLHGRACPPGESELDWPRRGPLGRRGAKGDQGPPGTTTIVRVPVHHPDRSDTLWAWIGEAVPAATNSFLLAGLGALAIALALASLGWLVRKAVGHKRLPGWLRWLAQPGVQIQPFDDSAMDAHIGRALASQTQARFGGGREAGMHLYLLSGEQPVDPALAELRGVPQTQPLAAAVSLLKLSWRRPQLIVSGALTPAGDTGRAALAVSLRRNAKLIATADFWPSEPPTASMTAADSNRVLAVAAAGWIEHYAVAQTPGPGASAVFYSRDARSWALFRAGAELHRMSALQAAADAYEQALAIDESNVGALVDLAHLRRRDGHFLGARALASRAVWLLSERHETQKADWYRANVVLATVWAEWAKSKELGAPTNPRRRLYRLHAYDTAMSLATSVMDLRESLQQATDPNATAAADQDLAQLLETTFEPGTLLLVAANQPLSPGAPVPPVPGKTTPKTGGITRQQFADLRAKARAALDRARNERVLDAEPLTTYIRALPLKSPRVEYNLACYWALASLHEPNIDRQQEQLDGAFEWLRRSISRSPQLERRGLLDHARADQDLRALYQPGVANVEGLEDLDPRRPPPSVT